MTTATYYKTTLALPIALPLLAFAEASLRGETQDAFYIVALYLLASVLFGGIPYLYTAYHLVREMSSEISPEEVQKLVETAPLRMLPACAIFWMIVATVCGVAYGVANEDILTVLGVFAGGIVATLFLSMFVLLFGYAYVLLARLGLAALRAFRVVVD